MKASSGVLMAVMVLAVCQFVQCADRPEAVVSLFDGNSLDGWEHFLVEPELKKEDVWSVKDGLLICKGKPMGYLATKREYTNFRLIVEWRWPAGTKPTNSGVLMRITGEPKALPKCVEAQLKHGNAGDIYGFHGFRVKGASERSKHAEGERIGKLSGVKKIRDLEKKPGEWNEYVITLVDGDLTLMINGEKANAAYNCDVVSGKIGLQSEGGEIHFRRILLVPLGK